MTESTFEPSDRRPIRSRNTRWAESMTNRLVRWGVSPNAISVAGMVAAVLAGVCFGSTGLAEGVVARSLWLVGALGCQCRLLCNLFDGMVAVRRHIASRHGELFNEVPDRISDAAVFIGLGYAAGGDLVLGYVAALVAVFVAYVRMTAKSTGAPNDFCGPMAKPQRMALVTAVAVYLALSPKAWQLSWGEPRIALGVIIVGGIVTAIRRLFRASRYLKRADT